MLATIGAMLKPWVLALAAGLAVLLLAVGLALTPLWQRPGRSTTAGADTSPGPGLPWQVQRLADGLTRVFGLAPGHDTLAQVRTHLAALPQGMAPVDLQVAVVARLDEAGALEALVEPFNAGFVSGRLVLVFDVPAERLLAWRAAATGSVAMLGGARRFSLRAADLDQAAQATLVGLSFVPALRLRDDDVHQRFGAPAETLALPPGGQALLYPHLGLAIHLLPGQRSVLQYVAPREFAERLRAPLLAPR